MSQQKRTVLIVDDFLPDQALYRRYLLHDQDSSYTILEATLGWQGLELWQQHQPDVVLLDYRLPDLEGLEFLAKLQTQSDHLFLPVIVIIEQGNEVIALQAIKAGAQDYLLKEQITPDSLRLRVNRVIETLQLRTQLQQRIQRERLLSQIIKKIDPTLNLEEILQATETEAGQAELYQHSPAELTQQQQVETALRSANERFELAAAAVNCLIYEYDFQKKTVARSHGLTQLLGYTPEEAENTAQWWHDRIHPDDFQPIQKYFQANISTTDRFASHYRVRHKDGHYIWVEDRNILVRDKAGEMIKMVGSTTDISDRKRAETELRESEERFRQLAENIDAVFWITDFPELRVNYVSSAYKRLWGLNPQDLYDDRQVWLNLIHPDDRESTERAFQQNAAVGLFDQEYRIVLPDGSVRWVRDRCFPLKDESGQVYRFTGIAEDITERKQTEASLQESQALFEAFMRYSPTTAYIKDETGRYLYVNPLNERISQRKIEDWLGKTDVELFSLQEAQQWRNNDLVALAANQAIEVIEIQQQTDGEHYFLSFKFPIHLSSERRLIGGLSLDITDRKKYDQAIRESEERLRVSLRGANQGTWDWDIKPQILTWDDRCKEIFGLPPEFPVTYEWHIEALHPDDRQQVFEAGVIALRDRTEFNQEYRTFHPDGAMRWVLARGRGYYDETGEPYRMSGTVMDISDRKLAEIALRESEERYRCLAELIPQLVWTANAEGLLLDVNQRWSEFTGLTLEQVQTEGWESVVHPDDLPILTQQWAAAVRMGTYYQAEGRMRRADGVYCWHLHQAIPQKNEDGLIIKWFGTATDIDVQKQLEAERDRILELEQTFRAAAERANRVKDEFLAILSHELRSPLNPILGWTKLLQTRNLDQRQTTQALETIERNVNLQTQLIDDLLDVAKILRGKLNLNPAPVNLVVVIESGIDTVKAAAIAKSIEIHAILPNIGQVSGDSARLQQIVWNLLSNAIKFTPKGGRVDIRLERVGNQAQIIVSDNGKGINPDFLPYIFESFRQEDISTTRQYGGLGLGLAIVRHLVEAHGGTIAAESLGEGQGATFTVSLPLLNREPEINPTRELLEQEPDLTGIRVLSVDDEPDTRELLTVLLTHYGAEAMTVTSAAEVLTALESFQPDILISDIGMPEVDGYTLLQKVRSLPPEKGGQIPAIALSAYAGETDQQRALSVGFQQHITKPIEPNQLTQALVALTKSAQFLVKL